MLTDHGLFLSFDGVPRSGRTTQADKLAATLTADGHDVVRVSLPHGDTPIAKTDRAWLDDVFGRYEEIVEREVVPALTRGAIVIADSWVTGALVRAQATGTLSTSECFFYEERALRLAPVDAEWLFPDVAPEQRAQAGFREAVMCREDARGESRLAPFVPVPGLGARRAAMRVVTAGWASGLAGTYAFQASSLITSRKKAAWADVIAETREQRDLAMVRAYLGAWTGTPPPFLAVAANWHDYSDATRIAALKAIPVIADASAAEKIMRLPATTPAVGRAIARKARAIRRAARTAAGRAKANGADVLAAAPASS